MFMDRLGINKVMQLTIHDLYELIEEKLKILSPKDEFNHIKAYKFLLQMANATIEKLNVANEPKKKKNTKDLVLIEEVQHALKTLGQSKSQIRKPKKTPRKKKNKKAVPFFKDEESEEDVGIGN